MNSLTDTDVVQKVYPIFWKIPSRAKKIKGDDLLMLAEGVKPIG